MSKPNVIITAQPAEGTSLVYGQLAAKSSLDQPNGQLSIVLTMTNQEASPVILKQVLVSFPGSNVPQSVIAANVTIDPSKTQQWYFPTASNIILPESAPDTVNISCSFDNYTDPVVVTMPLQPYQSPITGGGYLFPAKKADLAQGEFWIGRSAVHGGAGGGTQMFAYDLRIAGFDTDQQKWRTPKQGTDGTQNSHYHIWEKPVYAMAAGTVVQFNDSMADNTTIGPQNPTPLPVEGNHFYIQHGDDLALYAHFKHGTMNAALKVKGAAVAEGDFLGLAGNSGNSDEPHLHIQINRTNVPWGGPPRPLTFRDINVLELGKVDSNVWPPDTDSPWETVAGRALPNVWSAIWPGPIKYKIDKWIPVRVLAWAWLIYIGGLMITPGGIDCIVCGPWLRDILPIVSIALGVAGLASEFFGRNVIAKTRAHPVENLGADLHRQSER
jgi:hypothetical protein